ncbi:hypothetical protein D3C87_905490 [compost metagenome]
MAGFASSNPAGACPLCAFAIPKTKHRLKKDNNIFFIIYLIFSVVITLEDFRPLFENDTGRNYFTLSES